MRFVVGPPGTGKTTAVAKFLGEAESRVAYLAVHSEEPAKSLRSRIAEALGLQPELNREINNSYAAFVEGLRRSGPCQLALDEIDHASSEALEELENLIADAPREISFIYISRSRTSIDAGRLLARGLAAILDAERLAFSAEEIAQLAGAAGVGCTPADIARLLEETEGWPVVVSCVIREAEDRNASLSGAYDRWCKGSGLHFTDFLRGELDKHGEFYRNAFTQIAGDSEGTAADSLAVLEERGLFVRHVNGERRAYRVALQFLSGSARTSSAPAPAPGALLTVRMFGRFQASISNRPIEWIRRRDAQLFKYLLLTPNGTASREELRRQFWPDAESQLATQSIRTACSNIRRAIAAIVGYDNVDHYFVTRGEISVNLSNTVLDVRRFTAHVTDGSQQLERSNIREALAHYRAAESLYNGELLSGEYPEPWYTARASMYHALYIGTLEHLSELHAEIGDPLQARRYRERVNSLKAAARLSDSVSPSLVPAPPPAPPTTPMPPTSLPSTAFRTGNSASAP